MSVISSGQGFTAINNIKHKFTATDIESLPIIEFSGNNSEIRLKTSSDYFTLRGTFDLSRLPSFINDVGDLNAVNGELRYFSISTFQYPLSSLNVYEYTTGLKLDDSLNLALYLSNNEIINSYIYSENDTFTTTLDADSIGGFAGDDIVYGDFKRLASRPNEDDIFIGGDGIDKLVLQSPASSYLITSSTIDLGIYFENGKTTNSFAVSLKSNPSETITLESVEYIQFIDVTYVMNYETLKTKILKEATDTDDTINTIDEMEFIDGGAGIDTVIYDSNLSSIQTIVGGYIVKEDTLTNIERIQFSDANIALDTDGATSAGGIYRLYKATFNREPDHGGLGYWIAQADAGNKSAVQMAEDFTWSAEFQDLYDITTTDNYGTGTDVSDLVTGFYQNVLGRAPDQGGLDYYSGVIQTHEKTVGRVLAEISDSQENYDNTIDLIQNGIQYDLWVG